MTKRLLVYVTIVAATMWTIWAADMSNAGRIDRTGKVKGTDFLHFYVMGSIVREGRWDQLFDIRAHQVKAQALIPGSNDTLYIPVESPQLALLFAPFAAQPYLLALALSARHRLPDLRRRVRVDVARLSGAAGARHRRCRSVRGVSRTVHVGAVWTTAGLSLAAVAVACFALRRGWRLRAGLALGALVFKPHWVAAAAAVFLIAREWRILGGIALSALAQISATAVLVGAPVMRAYARMLATIPGIVGLLEPRPGDSLKGLFDVFVPTAPAALLAYAIAAIVTAGLAARVWRSDIAIDVRLAAILLATILISPHVNTYDLILVAPIGLMLANWLTAEAERGRGKTLAILLAVVVSAPLMAALPAMARLQFSATAMIAMLFLLWREACPPLFSGSAMRLSPAGEWPAPRAGSRLDRRG